MYFASQDFYDFIENHSEDDPIKLRLSKSSEDFNREFAITQIECRKKCRQKLSFFLGEKRFLFPDSVSGRQASHQAIAGFHSSLLDSETSILDMTAGLGIDALTFALNKQKKVTAIELDSNKVEVLKHNGEVFKLKNFSVIKADSIEYLRNNNQRFDLIFIDPSRIDMNNNRVYNFHDCLPDVVKFRELILSHAKRVFIKASPMLDISQTIRDFQNIRSIRAVGVKGECKEILIELVNPEFGDLSREGIILEAIDLDSTGKLSSRFSCALDELNPELEFASCEDLKPGRFLLEPSAMMMKISPWSKICKDFKAKKFDKSSHLFLSETLPEEFPGRVTRLLQVISKKGRKTLYGLPASVVSRNHPLSVDEIRKSFKLKEGERNFIYATRLANKPVVLLSETIAH